MTLMQQLSSQTMLVKVITAIHALATEAKCELLWPYDHGIGRPPVSGKIFVQPTGQLKTVMTIEYKFDMTHVHIHASGPNAHYPNGKLVYKNNVDYTSNAEMDRAFQMMRDHLAAMMAG